jgi:uncharacterized protein YabN with tetrapyrrole methylase and pyrophosphatase domain
MFIPMKPPTNQALRRIIAGLRRRSTAPRADAINLLLAIMARLRAPNGCPWDREQDHRTLRFHAVEEVYELMDAIEAGDDHEMAEELGDLLLQVVFHCQLARERKAFDFESVCQHIAEKLIRRHPHVFGDLKVKDVATVWANWDKIKRAEKLVKKARKAGLWNSADNPPALSKAAVARQLFDLAAHAQRRGWNAEELLRAETRRRERALRRQEKNGSSSDSRQFPTLWANR